MSRSLPFQFWFEDQEVYSFAKELWNRVSHRKDAFGIMWKELNRTFAPERLRKTDVEEPKQIIQKLPVTSFIKTEKLKRKQESPSLFSDDDIKYPTLTQK